MYHSVDEMDLLGTRFGLRSVDELFSSADEMCSSGLDVALCG